jgi:hypothetical protein
MARRSPDPSRYRVLQPRNSSQDTRLQISQSRAVRHLSRKPRTDEQSVQECFNSSRTAYSCNLRPVERSIRDIREDRRTFPVGNSVRPARLTFSPSTSASASVSPRKNRVALRQVLVIDISAVCSPSSVGQPLHTLGQQIRITRPEAEYCFPTIQSTWQKPLPKSARKSRP